MKKKIAILGSTGSIGKTLIEIIKRDEKNFKVELLTANKNYQELLRQVKFFNVKNIIITDTKAYEIVRSKIKRKKINIYSDFKSFNKIFTKKIEYVMSAITGIDGLYPTINIIKHTKNIAIANKESIICAWNLIQKELEKNKTFFIPVDSEHYSIWYALRKNSNAKIKKLYITASGGPLLNLSINQIKNVKISKVLNHPNWQMGKKISIDSATLMNKVFEIIEAKKIFNLEYKTLSILIHPDSYIHALIDYRNGLKEIIAHDTTMEIPIFNSLYYEVNKSIKSKKIDLKKLNNLNFSKVNYKKFPLAKIINKLPTKNSLFETVIVSANDKLVELYLENKIKFTDISLKLKLVLNLKEFLKFKKRYPEKINQIYQLNKYVRLKVESMSV
jgi:1-deoxy-D-xylulose-5-phosphate reductoisomerase